MQQTNLKEYRCACGKLLFKGVFKEGTVEVKCKNCRNISSFACGGETTPEVLAPVGPAI